MTDVLFRFTINVLHNGNMSLPNGSLIKTNKNEECNDEFISIRIYTKKGYAMRSFISSIHIYIHILIQKTQSRDRAITQSYNVSSTSHGDLFYIK